MQRWITRIVRLASTKVTLTYLQYENKIEKAEIGTEKSAGKPLKASDKK